MHQRAALVGIVARGIRARRVLEIGTGAGETGLAIGGALPADGMLITIERDEASAIAARRAFATAGVGEKISVMVGDAARYLHKVAGPFDLVILDADAAQYEALHDRLVQLLGPSATLLAFNVAAAGDYNEKLAADGRLTTVVVNLDGAVAIAVRQKDTHDA
jgi:predicted O-methyltransferase YrrM